MPQTHNKTESGFAKLDLSPKLHSVINQLGFTTPTPIQEQAIPVALTGRDVIGIAQTGTGKTLAFGLPMIHRLQSRDGVGLILVPTRELALQIEETFNRVAKPLGARTAVLIGGASMGKQISQLRAHPHFIVATPGRLMDHLQQKTLRLDDVTVVVLDEADRMLDMGFAPAIKRILAQVPEQRQTMLFSATMPDEIASLAQQYMDRPVRIEVERPGTSIEAITQELYVVPKEGKNELLERLLRQNGGTILVFARTRHGARKIARSVRAMGHSAAELHSDRTLNQRRAALDGFKSGAYRVLVATDIAARGIDVKQIQVVINYDLPENPEDYVHRIGRTGRAGLTGHAITIAMPDQRQDVRDIEKALRKELPMSQHSEGSFFGRPTPSEPRRAAGRASTRRSPRVIFQGRGNKPVAFRSKGQHATGRNRSR